MYYALAAHTENLMGNVIQFPTNGGRDWLKMETSVRDQLKASGLSNDGIEWVVADLKPRFLLMSFTSCSADDLPDACGPFVTKIVEMFHDLENQMWATLIMLEVDLYIAKLRGDRGP